MIRLNDEDIGFVLGGVFGAVYRGLQLSYRVGFERLEPGNIGQLEMIRRMSIEGVHTYDLGTDMDYKTKWAENAFTTQMLIIMPHHSAAGGGASK